MLLIDATNTYFFLIHHMEVFDPQLAQDTNTYLESKQVYFNHAKRQYIVEDNKIDELISWFTYENINYKISDRAIKRFKQLQIELYPKEQEYFRGITFDNSILNTNIKPYKFQEEGIKFMLTRKRGCNADDPGLGKAQPLYSNILTPFGFVKMGDIREGSEVISSTGDSCTVLRVFPQGIKDIYRVYFSDDTYVDCCEEHLWAYQTDSGFRTQTPLRVDSLKDLKEKGLKDNDGKRKFILPTIEKPIAFKNRNELLFPPYLLGILLSDGHLGVHGISLTLPDLEIRTKVKELLPKGCILKHREKYDYTIRVDENLLDGTNKKNNIVRLIKNYGLLETKSYNKFIPEDYKYTSIENRYLLLQGLFDGDGYVSKDGNMIQYDTTSEKLRDDIIFILRSLNFKVTVHNKRGKYKKEGKVIECGLCYTITPIGGDRKKLFSLTRKKSRIKEKYTCTSNRKRFDRIEYVGKYEAQCIKVNSDDSLYVTDGFNLTHNTFQTICTFSQLYKQGKIDAVFLVVKSTLPYHWKKEILEFVNIFSEDEILIVTNDNKIKCFDPKYKIIIAGNHLLGDIFGSYRADYNKLRVDPKTKKKYKISARKSNWQWKTYVDLNKTWEKNNIFLVVDESHELKNLKAVRTKALDHHKQFMDYRWFLSATPAINYFEDWYSTFHFIDPSVIKMSYVSFKIFISSKIGNRFSKETIVTYNPERIEEVRKEFPKYVLKRLKCELDEMKAKQILQPYYFQLPKEHKELYDLFMTEEIKKVIKRDEDFEKDTKFQYTDLQAIFNDFPYLLQIIDNPLLLKGKVESDKFNKKLSKWNIKKDIRFQFIKEQLKNYIEGNNEKVIIFDIHPVTLDALYEEFKDYNPLIVHGKIKESHSSVFGKVETFNDLKSKHKLFLFSTLKGGAGLNLQKGSRRIIYWTIPYDTTLFKQSMDRTHRINSTKDSILQIPLLDHSIDLIRFKRNTGRLELNDNILSEKLTLQRIREIFYGQV